MVAFKVYWSEFGGNMKHRYFANNTDAERFLKGTRITCGDTRPDGIEKVEIPNDGKAKLIQWLNNNYGSE